MYEDEAWTHTVMDLCTGPDLLEWLGLRRGEPVPEPLAAAIVAQVTQALVGLGWTERTAAEAVASVAESASEADRASVQSLLRLTLALLGPARKESVSG